MEKIKISLGNNTYLIAEKYPEESSIRELSIYIEKNGVVHQDIAVIRECYDYDDEGIINEAGQYEVLVWADEQSEDYTHKIKIKEYKYT